MPPPWTWNDHCPKFVKGKCLISRGRGVGFRLICIGEFSADARQNIVSRCMASNCQHIEVPFTEHLSTDNVSQYTTIEKIQRKIFAWLYSFLIQMYTFICRNMSVEDACHCKLPVVLTGNHEYMNPTRPAHTHSQPQTTLTSPGWSDHVTRCGWFVTLSEVGQ